MGRTFLLVDQAMRLQHSPDQRRGAVAVEAALILPFLLIMMLGTWEVGRLIQVNQIMINAAREGARLAAGGYVDGAPVTSTMVQQSVKDYMTASGLPTSAVSGSQVTLTCQATTPWTNPSDALPLDKFKITVVIPAGTAFDSLRWSPLRRITGTTQLSTTVNWMSLNNTKITVDTQLPY